MARCICNVWRVVCRVTKIFFVHEDSIVSVVSVAWRFRSLTHPHHVNYPVFCSSCHGGGQHITFVFFRLCSLLFVGGSTAEGSQSLTGRSVGRGFGDKPCERVTCFVHRLGFRTLDKQEERVSTGGVVDSTLRYWCRGNFPDLGWLLFPK